MKLQHFLIGDRLGTGDYRGACNALLENFGLGELPPSAEIRVNSSRAVDADHLIIYTNDHWYEWGERHGFRHAAYTSYRTDHRAVIYHRAVIWSKLV